LLLLLVLRLFTVYQLKDQRHMDVPFVLAGSPEIHQKTRLSAGLYYTIVFNGV
jgi:hypothetical protein